MNKEAEEVKTVKDKECKTMEPGASRKLTWKKPVLQKLLTLDKTSASQGGGTDGGIFDS